MLTVPRCTHCIFCLQLLNVTDGIFNFTEIRGPPGPMVRSTELLMQSHSVFEDVTCLLLQTSECKQTPADDKDRMRVIERLPLLTVSICDIISAERYIRYINIDLNYNTMFYCSLTYTIAIQPITPQYTLL